MAARLRRQRPARNPLFGLIGGKSAPARRAPARRAPSRREMEEQLRNAHRRAERAVDRIERAEYGTYAYEEAVRLGRLANRHLEQVEAKAFNAYGIEPRGNRGLVGRLLRRPAKERQRRTGLGELLFREGERQKMRRSTYGKETTATNRRAMAKTRPFTPIKTASGRGRRTKAPADSGDVESPVGLKGDALRDWWNKNARGVAK